METPLTPLEFMRRTRKLYANREGVVDGQQRWTYGTTWSPAQPAQDISFSRIRPAIPSGERSRDAPRRGGPKRFQSE